ncbi:MAG TPA: hypothetical protein VJX23_05455 [Candidatus Binataceae bacterium]|nr:hypothetical protein [Candidatus Binataceae bacterium]
MRRLCVRVLAALAAIFLAGCAVEGPAFQKPALTQQQSVVYVYRPYSSFGAAVVPAVNCGDHSIALGPGGYHAFVVDPGTIRCNVYSERTSQVEIDVQPGQEYFVRETPHWGILVARFDLEIPNPGEGPEEVRDCKLQ